MSEQDQEFKAVDVFEEEPDAFTRIRAYCESSDASGKLKVYRAVPNSRKENYLCDIDVNDFSPEIIKNRFGGGDFIIKAYDDRSKLSLKQHLSVEGEPVIERAATYQTQASAPPVPTIDMREIIAAMQESNRQMLAGFAQIMQPKAESSRASMLEEMLTMKTLFSTAAPVSSGGDQMSMLLKGIELAQNLTPKLGGETSGMDVLLESIKSFAPAIGAVVAQSQRAINPRAPGMVKSVSTELSKQPTAPKQIVGNEPINNESESDMVFKYYLGMLVGWAQSGKEPSVYAEVVADNMPESKLMDLLAMPDPITFLIEKHAGVANCRPWFESLLLELKIMYGLTEPVGQHTIDESAIITEQENAPLSDHNGDNSNA